MNERKITNLFVMAEGSRKPLGVLHIHDLLKAGLPERMNMARSVGRWLSTRAEFSGRAVSTDEFGLRKSLADGCHSIVGGRDLAAAQREDGLLKSGSTGR